MALARYEPWDALNQLHRQINRIFDTQTAANAEVDSSATADWIPAADIVEYGDRFVLKFDVPGVNPGAIDITLDNGVLTISGERAAEAAEAGIERSRLHPQVLAVRARPEDDQPQVRMSRREHRNSANRRCRAPARRGIVDADDVADVLGFWRVRRYRVRQYSGPDLSRSGDCNSKRRWTRTGRGVRDACKNRRHWRRDNVPCGDLHSGRSEP